MSVGMWLLNVGAAGFVLAIIVKRYCLAKRRPVSRWVPVISMCSIMCWGLGLLLILLRR